MTLLNTEQQLPKGTIPGRVLCVVGWWPEGANVAGIFIKEHIQAISTVAEVTVVYAEVEKGDGIRPTLRHWERVEDGLTVHHLRIRTPLRRFGISELLVRRAYKRLFDRLHRKGPFSLIHIHVRTEVTEQVIAATERSGLPIVITEHNSFYHLGIRALPPAAEQRQRRSITQWFRSPRIAAVMPVSRDLSNVLEKDFAVPHDTIRVVPNIAAAHFQPASAPVGPPFRMVLAAVWRPPKDHDVFIRALLLIPRAILDGCRIDWVGYGPDIERIQHRCRTELPHVDIRFPGYMDKEALAHHMQNAHLFVLPTTADNLPCVVIESLCCGTPVLSMAVNGLPELVHPGNGLLVPPRDPEALAAAIRSCVEGTIAFDRAAISSEALAKYSPTAVSTSILASYRSALRN